MCIDLCTTYLATLYGGGVGWGCGNESAALRLSEELFLLKISYQIFPSLSLPFFFNFQPCDTHAYFLCLMLCREGKA